MEFDKPTFDQVQDVTVGGPVLSNERLFRAVKPAA
jgi:hypothetical protein